MSALDVDALLAADGVRAPRQERSRATFERLLDAAERLLERDGVDGTSMSAVAAAAGSSVGALYTRVPDKVALVRAVQLRMLDRQLAALVPLREEGALAALELPALVRAFVGAVVHGIAARRGLVRAIVVQGVRDPVMLERVRLGLDEAAATLGALLEARRAEHRRPDARVAAAVVVRIVTGTVQQTVMLDWPLDAPRLATELERAVLAYLLAD